MIHIDSSNFNVVLTSLKSLMRRADPVKTERWQGVSANTDTRELRNVCFEVSLFGDESLETWREAIQPNLPWADDHFLERVGGEPLNPGAQWAKWPWGNSAAKFKQDRFNHTYMERLWPKYARRTADGCLPLAGPLRKYPQSDSRPKHGVAHSYGDLQDLVDLLSSEPMTRQAYIPLFFPEDTGPSDGGRKMCSLGYQVTVRSGEAHIWYPLRSCDLRRHFQDDAYLAVRMLIWVVQQCRLRVPDKWRGISVGTLAMHMTSLHVFESDHKDLEEGKW